MVKTERRPNTATLLKPTLLDTKLLGIFDMSTVSREHLLAIKNLVHSSPRCKCRPMTKGFSLKCEPQSKSSESDAKIQKMYKVLNKTYRIRTNVRQRLRDLSGDAPHDILPRVPAVPTPCVTCGRSEQPERFHSHPSRVEVKERALKEPEEPRKTVQKPVAMKFRSSKTRTMEANKEKTECSPKKTDAVAKFKENKSHKSTVLEPKSSPEKVNGVPKTKIKLTSKWKDVIKKSVQQRRELVDGNEAGKRSPVANAEPEKRLSEGGYKLDNWNPAPVSGGRKRKVVCYLCSQEFGTAVLPSHEAQCIQKYMKETTECDTKEENTVKEGPTPPAEENWKLAWEITQASLIPCAHCDRKFLPARLDAHQKICITKANKENIKSKVPVNGSSSQPGVLCEHCGKRYGSSSIAIHREQCARKCKNLEPQAEPSPRKPCPPPTVICYICGRNFGTKSISFHEPQCLKKWKLENEKLPPHLQRQSPTKSDDVVLAETETVDENSREQFWKAHQAQLVPCSKCGRTFYPDRLEVHVKGCKGPAKNKAKATS